MTVESLYVFVLSRNEFTKSNQNVDSLFSTFYNLFCLKLFSLHLVLKGLFKKEASRS